MGQIYGFSGTLPNVYVLMYINGKTPVFVSGAFMPNLGVAPFLSNRRFRCLGQ
jgi:hypothetical protein